MSTASHAPKQVTVLIVEDHAPMRAMLGAFLQVAFPTFGILEARDGAHAIDACATHRPQLVLVDICLPDANGIELVGRLKKTMPDARFIVASYLSGAVYRDAARAAGASAYVAKDRLPTELIPAVANALSMPPAAGWR